MARAIYVTLAFVAILAVVPHHNDAQAEDRDLATRVQLLEGQVATLTTEFASLSRSFEQLAERLARSEARTTVLEGYAARLRKAFESLGPEAPVARELDRTGLSKYE